MGGDFVNACLDYCVIMTLCVYAEKYGWDDWLLFCYAVVPATHGYVGKTIYDVLKSMIRRD